MTIPDPPWKRKTRPCPFYSQGRCLFSDSCSFLHDVKIKVQNPEITIISSPTPESTPALSRSDSITSSPASPGTVLNKVRSPPRSPRLSSLLLALGSAIPPEEEADDGSSPAEASTSRAAELVPPDAVLGQVSPRRSAVRELDNEAAQAEREVTSRLLPVTDIHSRPLRNRHRNMKAPISCLQSSSRLALHSGILLATFRSHTTAKTPSTPVTRILGLVPSNSLCHPRAGIH
ncbi:zinc finger CCCH domain-containing protein [Phanerochaete sordida]|uniref:Zinc finger CCCH domain-containing protein n=1 Tax=Phanerochaete sordida TaxID=48140 RepID=A0A9P3GJP5_9APHY|nr:zinc finger CCCH domain-containing protein [Phanerochaete sordida]